MNLVSVFDQGVGKSRKTNVSESFIMAVIQYIYIYIYIINTSLKLKDGSNKLQFNMPSGNQA